MSAVTVLATVGNDMKGFYTKLAADFRKARQLWLIISSAQTRSVLLAVGTAAIKLVKDATTVIADKGLSLTLDEQVWSDIRQLIADAKTGDEVIVGDLKALGIEL
jgi:uncharacterized membrane protein